MTESIRLRIIGGLKRGEGGRTFSSAQEQIFIKTCDDNAIIYFFQKSATTFFWRIGRDKIVIGPFKGGKNGLKKARDTY